MTDHTDGVRILGLNLDNIPECQGWYEDYLEEKRQKEELANLLGSLNVEDIPCDGKIYHIEVIR